MANARDFGHIAVDMGKLVRELRQDLKDDWFPDSLNFDDRLTPDGLSEAIERNFKENSGLFVPSRAVAQNIPKKSFVLRYSLETPLVDRAYYHALARQLQPYYDPLLLGCVLSHRWNSAGDHGDRYIFKHPIEQWQLFEGYVREDAGGNSVVLVTDVQNYYENISIEMLTEELLGSTSKLRASPVELVKVRGVIDELRRCLRSWCFKETNGLPQNRDASSIIANLYMAPVDEAMRSAGYRYYRYMDDIRVVAKNKYEARAALQELVTLLRRRGLNVNAGKTMILEPNSEKWNAELGISEPELRTIDELWKSRKVSNIRQSLGILKAYSLRLIQEQRTQERGFRFCIRRFENLALCEELKLPADYFGDIIGAAIGELDNQPYTSDQLTRFLKAAPLQSHHLEAIAALLGSSDKAIYDWQNYLLWQVLVYHDFTAADSAITARQVLSRSIHPGDRAGASLYLGAKGEQSDRERVARMFPGLSSPTERRAAIIAIHELDYAGVVEDVVAPAMPSCHLGEYRGLRQSKFRGRYFTKLEPITPMSIYDEISQYD